MKVKVKVKVKDTLVGCLDDATRFRSAREGVAAMSSAERDALLQELEDGMKSSAWATKELFKPGVRGFYMRELLGATTMVKHLEHFLGDQEYLFKFFFQHAFEEGKIPGVMDMLRQGINIPAFRFRLESIDMLVELEGEKALPVLFNLVSGLNPASPGARLILARVEGLLDDLATAVGTNDTFASVFGKFRLLLVETAIRFELESE